MTNSPIEEVEFVVVGCGPAGGTAAREAARAGTETMVLEKDAIVGAKRVCAAGLRPGFARTFDLPQSIIHFDTPRIALFTAADRCYDFTVTPAHTTTREELDGTIAELARGEGAEIRTSSLFRGYEPQDNSIVVHYADGRSGERKALRCRNLFLAQGATARLEETPFHFRLWDAGLITTLQYRVYLQRRAAQIAYSTLELHYFLTKSRRQIVGWMFPKRDHLAIGLGVVGKMPGKELRDELNRFTERVQARLYPDVPMTVRQEGHLLYGGFPRHRIAIDAVMVGGTAAGLVDATTGEGIYEAALSGRFAALALRESHRGTMSVGKLYERWTKDRLYRKLSSRVALLSFLQRKQRRFDVLFRQLATTPRFADIMQREDEELKFADRAYLCWQIAKFSASAAVA
ncbi:MAG: NAD(P)/FAD-dependent oxidoreductase [Candidatus Eremiobacteraeota bacterium]|nr:NAD(P)/FAD-dependent oxidoreductase [Candidatus Eremiobacteraeota bacterium]